MKFILKLYNWKLKHGSMTLIYQKFLLESPRVNGSLDFREKSKEITK